MNSLFKSEVFFIVKPLYIIFYFSKIRTDQLNSSINYNHFAPSINAYNKFKPKSIAYNWRFRYEFNLSYQAIAFRERKDRILSPHTFKLRKSHYNEHLPIISQTLNSKEVIDISSLPQAKRKYHKRNEGFFSFDLRKSVK